MRFPDVALHEEFIGEKKEGGYVVHPPHHLLEINSQINVRLRLLSTYQRIA
jgi:hypothetical protein